MTLTETCGGPTVSDASVVSVALVILLLLTPELSEVGIFGLSLKRRLEAAEKKVDTTEAKADRLETQLHLQTLRVETLSQNAAAAAAQGIGNLYIMTGEKLEDVDSDLRKKAATFNWDAAGGRVPADTPFTATSRPDRALVWQIMENWEIISASLYLPPYRPGRGAVAYLPAVALTEEQASRFRSVFAEELQVVRAARNSAVHFAPLTNDELQKAIDISDQLLRILRSSPDQPPGTSS